MEDLFERAPIPRAYFKLALPVVPSMVASMIYNLADTFFVSQTQNTNLVAGVALCTPLDRYWRYLWLGRQLADIPVAR